MNNNNKILLAALNTVFALSAATLAVNSARADTTTETEKCYGIVKASMNDCMTATSSCAGSAKKDAQADAFILLPTGTCHKIVGGELTIKSKTKSKH